jgi:hypothetical protein
MRGIRKYHQDKKEKKNWTTTTKRTQSHEGKISQDIFFSFTCRRADKSPVVNPEPVNMTSPKWTNQSAAKAHYVHQVSKKKNIPPEKNKIRYVYKNIWNLHHPLGPHSTEKNFLRFIGNLGWYLTFISKTPLFPPLLFQEKKNDRKMRGTCCCCRVCVNFRNFPSRNANKIDEKKITRTSLFLFCLGGQPK